MLKPIIQCVLIALVAVLVAGVYERHRQDEGTLRKPEPQESLRGVQLGMTVEDVTLVFGDKPSSVEPDSAVWDIAVGFFTVALADKRVTEVCVSGNDLPSTSAARVDSSVVSAFRDSTTLYYVGDSTDTLNNLGDEFYTSVNADSTTQIRTWPKLHVAFESHGPRITGACLTRRPIRYANESRFIGPKEMQSGTSHRVEDTEKSP